MLPEFKLYKDPEVKSSNILPGLAKGGEAVIKSKETFQKALEVLVALAGLQTSFMLLDEAIKVGHRCHSCRAPRRLRSSVVCVRACVLPGR